MPKCIFSKLKRINLNEAEDKCKWGRVGDDETEAVGDDGPVKCDEEEEELLMGEDRFGPEMSRGGKKWVGW